MTLQTLIRRSLRFHLRSHLGVMAGVAIGSAALTGALVVGDSVRGTLTQTALARLGPAYFAMFSGDRFFLATLRQRLCSASSKSDRTKASPSVCPMTYAIVLPGVASRQDGSARANQVTIIGVEDPAWPEMANWAKLTDADNATKRWRAGEVAFINGALARQLNARSGDDIVLRIRKPSALGLDAAISPKNENTISLRLKIGVILDDAMVGDFSLFPGQTHPVNLFLPYEIMRKPLGMEERANLMLVGRITRDDAGHNEGSLATALKNDWLLEDAQLQVRVIEQELSATGSQLLAPCVEVSSPRIFLEDATISAALRPRSELLNQHQGFENDSTNDLRLSSIVTNGFGVLTYLANLIQAGDRATPYSMITAAAAPLVPAEMRDDEIIVNDWLAEDLAIKPADSIRLVYYAVDSGARLVERTNEFRVRQIVPITGQYADRTLMPEFPGVAKAESTHDWDTGFPLNYTIREKDEAYWKKYRGTPKAFVTLKAGQSMWANRFGSLTAIRYPIPANIPAEVCRVAVYRNLLANLQPTDAGLQFDPVRDRALQAARQSQDFGGLFLGFSFFLVVSSLLLMALLFQFGLEQRAVETGTLLSLGFMPRTVRRLLLGEGAAIAAVGSGIGALCGIGYAWLMLWGLNHVWNAAVGGATLRFHASAESISSGLIASIVIALTVIWFTLRKQARQPARALLAGQIALGKMGKRSYGRWIAIAATVSALALLVWAFASGQQNNPEMFFSIGCLLLIGGLAGSSAWLRRVAAGPAEPAISLASLGLRGCARRRTRSLTTIALLASGVFVISSIGVFRLESNRDSTAKTSGTGGFALIGQSTLPIVKDLNTPSGQEFFGLNSKDLAGVGFVSFRVKQGEEASCLNLNRAQKPRLLGVLPQALEGRFTFTGAAKGHSPREGWRLLGAKTAGEPDLIPAIGDAAAIEWALGKKLGDTIDYTDERGHTVKLLLIGAVANSVLQGSLVIGESQFIRHFPGESGYRMFLIDTPSNALASVSAVLSRALEDTGLELVPAAIRLDQFNAVQNTYLGTFQVLGGLGLLLGSAGLGIVVLRNVMERRGELGLLAAVGFTRRRLQHLLLGEHGALLLSGLVIGLISAAAAVLPDLITPGKQLPALSLGLTLAAVLLNGLIWTWAATTYSLRGNLVAALRNE